MGNTKDRRINLVWADGQALTAEQQAYFLELVKLGDRDLNNLAGNQADDMAAQVLRKYPR